MSDNTFLNGLATNVLSPNQGGLNVADYPNPYGLRAYKLPSGQYGGEMLPKSTGWLGIQQAPDGSAVTEYSVGDEKGDFPSLVPGLNPQEIDEIVKRQAISQSAMQKAKRFADVLRSQGEDPFYNPFLDQLARKLHEQK